MRQNSFSDWLIENLVFTPYRQYFSHVTADFIFYDFQIHVVERNVTCTLNVRTTNACAVWEHTDPENHVKVWRLKL